MKNLNVNWSEVITHSVTVLVAGVFLAAATLLWTNTQENRKKINTNFIIAQDNMKITEERLANKIATLEIKLNSQKEVINRLVNALDSAKDKSNSENSNFPDFDSTMVTVDPSTPFKDLDFFKPNEKNREENIDRFSKELLDDIQNRQQPLNLPSTFEK